MPDKNVREKCLNYLKESNIYAQIHYPAINKMKGFLSYDSKTPVSDEISSRVISIPMYPQMTFEEQEFTINKLNEFSKN